MEYLRTTVLLVAVLGLFVAAPAIAGSDDDDGDDHEGGFALESHDHFVSQATAPDTLIVPEGTPPIATVFVDLADRCSGPDGWNVLATATGKGEQVFGPPDGGPPNDVTKHNDVDIMLSLDNGEPVAINGGGLAPGVFGHHPLATQWLFTGVDSGLHRVDLQGAVPVNDGNPMFVRGPVLIVRVLGFECGP